MEQTAHVAAGIFPVREMDLFLWCRGFSLMQQLESAASHPELAVFPFPLFPPNLWLLGLELCHKKLPTLIPQCAIKIQIKKYHRSSFVCVWRWRGAGRWIFGGRSVWKSFAVPFL